MIKLNLILLLFLKNALCFAIVEPKYEIKAGQAQLVLGSDVQKALKLYDPTFHILQSHNYLKEALVKVKVGDNKLPFSLIEDFNEDQVNDLVVLGMTSNGIENKVLALLVVSKKSRYDVFLVESWSSSKFLHWIENKKGQKEITNWSIFLKKLSEDEKRRLAEAKMLMVPKKRKGFKTIHINGSGQPYYFLNNKIYTFFKTPQRK